MALPTRELLDQVLLWGILPMFKEDIIQILVKKNSKTEEHSQCHNATLPSDQNTVQES